MSSPDLADAAARPRDSSSGIAAILDAIAGFLVWAVHFVALYVAAAVACVVGMGNAASGVQRTFIAILALATIATALGVLLHGFRRYRQQREVPHLRFRMGLTIGCDALAALAILAQLLPLALVPLCR